MQLQVSDSDVGLKFDVIYVSYVHGMCNEPIHLGHHSGNPIAVLVHVLCEH